MISDQSGQGDSDREPTWELSGSGREFWEQILSECSKYAGRPITGDDLGAVMKKVRDDTGLSNPEFTDRRVMESFLRHLRALGDGS